MFSFSAGSLTPSLKEAKNWVSNHAEGFMVYIAFIILFLTFGITLRNVGAGFWSINNLMNIIRQTALIAVMSVGMAFVLGSANIDLSVGSIVGVVSLVTALTIKSFGVWVGVLAGLATGIGAGIINGFLVAFVGIPAFLATLGTMISFAGLSRTMTNLRAIPIMSSTYNRFFGGGTIGFVPVLLVWMIVTVVAGHLILRKASFGRKILAVGGNQQAARYSGINVRRIKFFAMVTSGFLAGLAGILWAGRFGGGRYSLGEGAELSVIAATVLGGTSIFGGRSTVIGAAVGALLIGMVNNALVLYGLSVYQQQIIRGIVIIVAVASTVATSSE